MDKKITRTLTGTLEEAVAVVGREMEILLDMLGDKSRHLDIVFDGDPFERNLGKAGLFCEVEGPAGTGIKAGTWIDRGDGFWALRLTLADFLTPDSGQEKDCPSSLSPTELKNKIRKAEKDTGPADGYLGHFLGWLEDTDLFEEIPRGFSNLLPEEPKS